MEQHSLPGVTSAVDSFSFDSKVICDGRPCLLRVDDNFLHLSSADARGGKGEKRNCCRRGSHNAPLRVPIREILAVKYSDECQSAASRCSCCGSENPNRSNARRSRTLSSYDIALLPISKRCEQGSDDVAGGRFGTEKEVDAIVVYFITRKADYVWRPARIVCHFGVAHDDSVQKSGSGTSPSMIAAEFLKHLGRRVSAQSRPSRLLVFVNPFGGKRRAAKLYEKHAAPIFNLCSISTTVVLTQRANHAKDYVTEADLSSFDGIVTTGGDGLFNEVLNGLLVRNQREANIDMNNRLAALRKPHIPIGVIAAGSTNALAHTIHGTDDVLTSVLHIAIGDTSGVDVCGVYSEERFLRFAATAVSFGFLGDVLKESERLRRFGPPRYILSGIKVWIKNTHYAGLLRYRTLRGSTHDGNANKMKLELCRALCNQCSEIDPTDEPAAVNRGVSVSSFGDGDDSYPMWSIVDNFTHIVGVVTSCVCKMAPKGIGPHCHLGDGYMHLALVPRVGRLKNLDFILKIMSKTTDHTRADKFKLFVVKEFSFTPEAAMQPTFADSSSDVMKSPYREANARRAPTECSPSPASGTRTNRGDEDLGAWNVDGELLPQPSGSIYFRVHRQLITLFARGIEASSSADVTDS